MNKGRSRGWWGPHRAKPWPGRRRRPSSTGAAPESVSTGFGQIVSEREPAAHRGAQVFQKVYRPLSSDRLKCYIGGSCPGKARTVDSKIPIYEDNYFSIGAHRGVK